MSKAEKFLTALKENVGNWTCSLHTTGSNQPAAIFREVKNWGYEFEATGKGKWAASMICPICNQKTSHYKLLKLEPTLTTHKRLTIDSATRKRILKLFNKKDAFTGASISSTPEIDHKIPWTRLDNDIDARHLNDSEIRLHFQLLTREHNLLKDRACKTCKINNIRPPFMEIPYWYDGDNTYRGSCIGCGWYDGVEWRKELVKLITHSNKDKSKD